MQIFHILRLISVGTMLLANIGYSQFNGTYSHLSQEAAYFFSQFSGTSDPSESYGSLEESQKATYEAIMHALKSEGLINIVSEVTAIWGVSKSKDGRSQYRLSVKLASGAVEYLLNRSDYHHISRGHVKLKTGKLYGIRDADSVKDRDGVPTLQISWLEDDFTIGDIDIDYRKLFQGHNNPANSDVRSFNSHTKEFHYDKHIEEYGDGLLPWWRN